MYYRIIPNHVISESFILNLVFLFVQLVLLGVRSLRELKRKNNESPSSIERDFPMDAFDSESFHYFLYLSLYLIRARSNFSYDLGKQGN
jgi:hypothetical protein